MSDAVSKLHVEIVYLKIPNVPLKYGITVESKIKQFQICDKDF